MEYRQQPATQEKFLVYLKSCLAHGLTGRAIPVAVSCETRGYGHQEVLQARGEATLSAHVFEQQERSSGFEHTSHFLQTARGIANGAKDERSKRAIEALIG